MRHVSILAQQYVSVAHVPTYAQTRRHRNQQKAGNLFRNLIWSPQQVGTTAYHEFARVGVAFG